MSRSAQEVGPRYIIMCLRNEGTVSYRQGCGSGSGCFSRVGSGSVFFSWRLDLDQVFLEGWIRIRFFLKVGPGSVFFSWSLDLDPSFFLEGWIRIRFFSWGQIRTRNRFRVDSNRMCSLGYWSLGSLWLSLCSSRFYCSKVGQHFCHIFLREWFQHVKRSQIIYTLTKKSWTIL